MNAVRVHLKAVNVISPSLNHKKLRGFLSDSYLIPFGKAELEYN
jgi:hypothetical protein